MNQTTEVNDFLAYLGVVDPQVLSQVVTADDPTIQRALKHALKQVIALTPPTNDPSVEEDEPDERKDYKWVISNRLLPLREAFVAPFPSAYEAMCPRFIEVLITTLIIENHILSTESFLPDYRYDNVRSTMFALLPDDMCHFPHEATRQDFRNRIAEIRALPPKEKDLLLAAARADSQWQCAQVDRLC